MRLMGYLAAHKLAHEKREWHADLHPQGVPNRTVRCVVICRSQRDVSCASTRYRAASQPNGQLLGEGSLGAECQTIIARRTESAFMG